MPHFFFRIDLFTVEHYLGLANPQTTSPTHIFIYALAVIILTLIILYKSPKGAQ